MEKINVAELLKDCPKGMKLDCSVFDNLELDHIDENKTYSIICRVKTEFGSYNVCTFTKYGCYSTEKYAKCVIFPKGKTTWEEFQRPFKDGDILYLKTVYEYEWIFINKIVKELPLSESKYYKYANFNQDSSLIVDDFPITYKTNVKEIRFATEEEKQKLFDAIKASGYKWNAETKTLEKLPKFKVGNRIKYKKDRNKDGIKECIILSITDDTYDVAVTNDIGICIPISDEYNWELVPNEFDINTLKPFDRVLVRCSDNGYWQPQFFSKFNSKSNFPFQCIYNSWSQCIPYEGNEHLLGKTNDCDEFYKTWK